MHWHWANKYVFNTH